MQALHDIAEAAAWESEIVGSGDAPTRAAQLEKSLGQLIAIRTMSARFLANKKGQPVELDPFIHRKVIWSKPLINGVEASSSVQTVWLATPDLEPDMSHTGAGLIVRNNLRAGKNYVYFYPAAMPLAAAHLQRLRRNIGADDRRLGRHVAFVAIPDWARYTFLQSNGNTILFFEDSADRGPRQVLQEVVLNKVGERGVLWQECGAEEGALVFNSLRALVTPEPTP